MRSIDKLLFSLFLSVFFSSTSRPTKTVLLVHDYADVGKWMLDLSPPRRPNKTGLPPSVCPIRPYGIT